MNVIINGLATSYEESGKGPGVLLLHGWGQTGKTYKSLMAELSANYRVITLDLPGFGGSQRPGEDWDISHYAAFVQSFLSKIKADHVEALIGHSFGGRIALKGVATGVLRAERLILINTAGVRHSQSARNTAFWVVAKLGKVITTLPGLRSLRRGLRQKLYQTAGSDDYVTAGNMKGIFSKVIAEDLQTDAASITIPTLLIWGEDDKDTPLADGQKLHEQIENSRLEVLVDAGHFSYIDQPDKVLRLIKEALE